MRKFIREAGHVKRRYLKTRKGNGKMNVNIPWKDEEDRIANFYITTNPDYGGIGLPKIIKINNPQPGEVAIYKKRNTPKIARIQKKREDNDAHISI